MVKQTKKTGHKASESTRVEHQIKCIEHMSAKICVSLSASNAPSYQLFSGRQNERKKKEHTHTRTHFSFGRLSRGTCLRPSKRWRLRVSNGKPYALKSKRVKVVQPNAFVCLGSGRKCVWCTLLRAFHQATTFAIIAASSACQAPQAVTRHIICHSSRVCADAVLVARVLDTLVKRCLARISTARRAHATCGWWVVVLLYRHLLNTFRPYWFVCDRVLASAHKYTITIVCTHTHRADSIQHTPTNHHPLHIIHAQMGPQNYDGITNTPRHSSVYIV